MTSRGSRMLQLVQDQILNVKNQPPEEKVVETEENKISNKTNEP